MRRLCILLAALAAAGPSPEREESLVVEAAGWDDAARAEPPAEGLELEVAFGPSLQPLVEVSVGGQPLRLVLDTSSGNTIVFARERGACLPPVSECYSADLAEREHTLRICSENNDQNNNCDSRGLPGLGYSCNKFLEGLNQSGNHTDALLIDGAKYNQLVVEGLEEVLVKLQSSAGERSFNSTGAPVRLLVKEMDVVDPQTNAPLASLSLQLFQGASGLLGASGPSLSCRNDTLWSAMLRELRATRFALDLQPPPNVSGLVAKSGRPSKLVLQEVDEEFAKRMVWSQTATVTSSYRDGLHQFLLYHLEVCGVDLLYNTSSNWLALVDTSARCLTLPPFLFERFRARTPISCPFQPGESSKGRLCSLLRDAGRREPLPSLEFQLEDDMGPAPPRLRLPLERLVFRNGSGHEFLCVVPGESIGGPPGFVNPDMTANHIALGSLAASAFYIVFDLENHSVGMASKSDPAESSDNNCTPAVACRSSMQTYYPPLNVCEDPRCSEYMFMTLDEDTRTCRWSSVAPAVFGGLLAALALLDLISHRLYKQAIDKASEYCR